MPLPPVAGPDPVVPPDPGPGRYGENDRPAVTEKFRLLLIDPSALSRSCFVAALEGMDDIEIVGIADIDELNIDRVTALRPHVVALRITGESLSDDQLTQRFTRLGRLFPPAQTMVLARHEAPDQLLSALRMGLGGFITTDLSLTTTIKAMELLREGLSVFSYGTFQSLYRVMDSLAPKARKVPLLTNSPQMNEANLTARQREVLQLLVDGMSNKAIAFRLGISESTVKVHIRAIMERAGVISRTQIISRFLSGRK